VIDIARYYFADFSRDFPHSVYGRCRDRIVSPKGVGVTAAAKALGPDLPTSVLARADEVIE
jgi:hypothetical protein